MTVYCRAIPLISRRVACLLCKGKLFLKDEWTLHFRYQHWKYYFSMVPESVSSELDTYRQSALVPKNDIKRASPGSIFSADKWITIEDVTEDVPIARDEAIIDYINRISVMDHYLAGPVMIQRFVVIYQGEDTCLCLGIHTYENLFSCHLMKMLTYR